MSADSSLDRALHAIADPTRRRILQVLKESGTEARTAEGKKSLLLAKDARGAAGHVPCLCGGEIEERIHLSQPTISHHMGILTKAGLVEATKQGQWRWYRRNEKAIRLVVKGLRGKL